MTTHVATLPETETEIRWREWKTRGAESDRRTAKRMRLFMLFILAVFAIWSSVQLLS
jgi:hypothetical protein